MPRNQKNTRTCVVLIHGTWATGANWTEPSSTLSQILKKCFGDGLCIERFRWSGHNSHSARLKAGAQLASFIRELSQRFPRAKCYLIAHSHGGNVAAYALRDKELQPYVSGIVCLATPFVVCSVRNVLKAIKIGARTIFVFLISFAVLASLYLRPGKEGFEPGPFYPLYFSLAVFAIIIFLILLGRRYLIRPLRRLALERQKRIIAALEIPSISFTRILCLAPQKDEAHFYLRILDRISEFPHRLWTSNAFFWVGGLTFSIIIISEIFYFQSSAALLSHLYALPYFAFLTVLVLLFFQFSLQIIMMLLPRLVRSHPFGFGWEGFTVPWLVRVDVQKTPKSFSQSEYREYQVSGSGLRHSQLYQDEACLTDIASWIDKDDRLYAKGHPTIGG